MRFWRFLAVNCALVTLLLVSSVGAEAHGATSATSASRHTRSHTTRTTLAYRRSSTMARRSTTKRVATRRNAVRRSAVKPATTKHATTRVRAAASLGWGGRRVHPMFHLVRGYATASYASGFTPEQIEGAYGLGSDADGSGITIGIVTAYDDPTAAHDFDVFSEEFGLPTISGGCGCFTKVNQSGGKTYPRANATWALEASLDIEWAHAIAPGARILLVEGASDDLSVIIHAVDYATAHAQVVSNSWGEAEFSGERAYDFHFKKGVAITVAAGDTGTPAEYPSASPYVLSVGGTTLKIAGANSDGSCDGQCSYGSETAWGSSGGGASVYEPMPSFQKGVCPTSVCHGKRGTPDVAWIGDTSSGVAIYDSTLYTGSKGWWVSGGTSVGAPSIAGLIARMDEAGGTRITTNYTTSRLDYQFYHNGGYGDSGYGYDGGGSFYHDITSGSNGKTCCHARKGYDLATGIGSPIGYAWLQGG